MARGRNRKVLLVSAGFCGVAGAVFYGFHAMNAQVLAGLVFGWAAGIGGLAMFHLMMRQAEKSQGGEDHKRLANYYTCRLAILIGAVLCAVWLPFIDALATVIGLILVTPAASLVLMLEKD